MVDVNSLANMFSQKTGAQQSIAMAVINAVIGFMMQRGIGSMLGSSSQGGNQGGIMSALSNLVGGGNSFDQNHELVQHVQQNAGIKDPQQATQYTQQAVDLLKEHGNNNPQGLQSLFSNLMGGQSQQNNQKSDKGLLGDVMGGLGI
jgi:hypothetical protein